LEVIVMGLTADLTLRSSRQAADAVFATASLAAMAEIWLTWKKELFGAYRPERHYMRGPGPKWYAKHAQEDSIRSMPRRSQTGDLRRARWSARDCVIQAGGEHTDSAAH
jgi:hypothetical protein